MSFNGEGNGSIQLPAFMKQENTSKLIPEQCPKSASPYNGCPFVFRHEDDMVLSYITMLINDIKIANGDIAKEAKIIDRYACQITAYMNGRIHQIVFGTK